MAFAVSKVSSGEPTRRLLIMKMGAIGDVAMVVPAALEMYKRGYSIDWVCSETIAPILSLYPWIKVIPVDERQLFYSGKGSTLRTLLALWRDLPSRHYDLCATLYYDPRYKLLSLPIRAGRKILLSKTDRSNRLLPGRHHTDEYARILLSQIPESYAESATPSQLAPVRAEGLPPNPVGRVAGKSRVVLVPGGARNVTRDDALRRWPLQNYVEVATALIAQGHEVLLAGGPDDQWAVEDFAEVGLRNFVGQLSLLETLSLLDSADVTVTHDTGPLHLAGLTSTAIVTIFGPTDPRGRLPQRANCVALWGGEGFACRPCYDGRDYAPCLNNGCVQQITPAMVLAEIETLLIARREKKPLLPRVRTPKHTPVPVFVRLKKGTQA